MSKPTICLAMIVKNEEQDIKRCLDSVAPYIDYWVISDTGSEDNTMPLIQEIMDGHRIKGELHEHKWKDFSSNRNAVLEIARKKADFVWFMDADDNFVTEDKKPFRFLDKSQIGYGLKFIIEGHIFSRTAIVNSKFNWSYKGVLHEVLYLDGETVAVSRPNNCHVIARSSPTKRAETKEEKYAQDAKILLKEHKKNPEDTRTIFYLAQSYRDSGQLEKAIKYYNLRLKYPNDGYKDELEIASIEACKAMVRLKKPAEKCLMAALKSWQHNPYRPEPPILAMEILMTEEMWFQAFIIGESAGKIMDSSRVSLFVDDYDQYVRFRSHFAYCCYKISLFELAYKNQELIIESEHMPEKEKESAIEKLKAYKKAYDEQTKRHNADNVEVKKD